MDLKDNLAKDDAASLQRVSHNSVRCPRDRKFLHGDQCTARSAQDQTSAVHRHSLRKPFRFWLSTLDRLAEHKVNTVSSFEI